MSHGNEGAVMDGLWVERVEVGFGYGLWNCCGGEASRPGLGSGERGEEGSMEMWASLPAQRPSGDGWLLEVRVKMKWGVLLTPELKQV